MQITEVKRELGRIARTYATVGGLLRGGCVCDPKPTNGCPCQTTGKHWASILADLPATRGPDGERLPVSDGQQQNFDAHLSNVCGEYADGERPLPDRTDNLVFEIRTEALKRYHRDFEEFLQHERYKPFKAVNAWQTLAKWRMAHAAIELGRQKRDRELDCDDSEYAQRVQIVLGLNKLEYRGEKVADEDLPDWLRALVGGR